MTSHRNIEQLDKFFSDTEDYFYDDSEMSYEDGINPFDLNDIPAKKISKKQARKYSSVKHMGKNKRRHSWE